MNRKVDGMISFGQCTLVVIVFIKCSLAVAVNELEVEPQINLVADEVKEQLDKVRTNLKEGEDCGSCYMGFCPDYCIRVSNHSSNCGACGKGLKCLPSAIETPGKCIKKREQKGRSLQEFKRPALCNLNKKTGCEAAIPRFFFNKKTGKCEKFIFGGCRGNKNNFEKKTSCEITCGVARGFSG